MAMSDAESFNESVENIDEGGGDEEEISDEESFNESVENIDEGGGSSGGSSGGGSSGGSSSDSSDSGIVINTPDYETDDSGGGGGGGGSGGSSGGSSSESISDAESFKKTLENNPQNQEKKLPDSKDKINQAQKFRELNPAIAAANPEEEQALKTREQNLEAKNQVEESINYVESAPENSEIILGEGENKETVQRDKAVQKLEKKKQEVNQTLKENEQLYKRTQNPKRTGPRGRKIIPSKEFQKDVRNLMATDGRTTESVKERAKKGDLDNLQVQGSIPIVGNDTIDFKVGGTAAKALASFDTFTSDQGFKQLSTLDPRSDKKGSQFIKENVVESRRNQDYNVVRETTDVLSSPGGTALTAAAGGAAFKGATTTLTAQGGKTAAVGKAAEVGGVAAGGAYAAKEGKQTLNQYNKGNINQGTANLLKLGTEFGGFGKGVKATSRGLSARIAKNPGGQKVVKGNQLNRIVQTDEGFTGKGKFQGRFNVKAPKISQKLGIAQSGQGQVRSRFSVFGDDSSSQAKGIVQVKTPGNKPANKQKFEAVNIAKGKTETPSGKQKTKIRSQVQKQNEGRFFRSTETEGSTSTIVKQSDRTQRIVNIGAKTKDTKYQLNFGPGKTGIRFDGQKMKVDSLSEKGRIVTTTSNTKTDSGDINTISKTRSIIQESNPGNGGAGGTGVRGTQDSGTGTTLVSQSRSRIGNQVNSKLNDFSSQISKTVEDSLKISSGLATGGGGTTGGSREATASLSQELETSQRQKTGNKDQQFSNRRPEAQVQTVENTQIQRTKTGQELLGERNQGGQVQKRDSGSQLDFSTSTRNIQTPKTDQKTRQITRQQTKQKQKTRQINRQRQKNLQINTPGQGLRNIQTPRQKTFQGQKFRQIPLQRINTKPKTQFKTAQIPGTVTTPGITTKTGLGIGGLDLELRNIGTGPKSNASPGTGQGGSISLDILSANRAELETGTKTFQVNQDTVTEYNQTPFSGGVKTLEEQKLGDRKLINRENNQQRYF